MAIYLVMGVSGSGKSTLGKALATAVGCPYLEGDDFHPRANIAKMEHGIPLTDEDRWPWLKALSIGVRHAGDPCVFACSALKQQYRDYLHHEIGGFRLVFLKISEEDAAKRVAARQHHYMVASLVPTQFLAMEPPTDALVLDATLPVDQLVAQILSDAAPI